MPVKAWAEHVHSVQRAEFGQAGQRHQQARELKHSISSCMRSLARSCKQMSVVPLMQPCMCVRRETARSRAPLDSSAAPPHRCMQLRVQWARHPDATMYEPRHR